MCSVSGLELCRLSNVALLAGGSCYLCLINNIFCIAFSWQGTFISILRSTVACVLPSDVTAIAYFAIVCLDESLNVFHCAVAELD